MSQPNRDARVRLIPTLDERGKTRIIRDPDRDYQIVPPEGVTVSPRSKNYATFWLRRVRDGEMKVAREASEE